MRYLVLFVFLFCKSASFFSQSDNLIKKKSKWYISWGYTRAIYSKSTIHFQNLSNRYNPITGNNDYYDFTIHDVSATDRPDFNKIKDVINITVPQFVARVGFMFNDKWGIEMNYDHTKYLVIDYQKTNITGQIFGVDVLNDPAYRIIDPVKFLHFEHTDGANFWMLNSVRKWKLYNPTNKFYLSWVLKPGAGIVYPRTDVSLFGQQLNNDWHIAGWIVGLESGLRIEFLKHGFFELVVKESYADYVKCLVLGKGNGSARHQFFTGQLTGTIGLRFDSKK